MMLLHFKQWLENQTLGGGLEPPKQDPNDTSGHTHAFQTYHMKDSQELPPTKRNRKIKKRR